MANKTFRDTKLHVTWTKASTRGNISSNENLSVSLGKIAKWFTDFKDVVWTGTIKGSDITSGTINNDRLNIAGIADDAWGITHLSNDINSTSTEYAATSYAVYQVKQELDTHSHTAFVGATSSQNGEKGFVPAPHRKDKKTMRCVVTDNGFVWLL